MTDVTVTPEVLEGFGAVHAAIAAAVAGAGSINAAANTAVMIPVFGLIGQEFLASFIAAQANHLASVGELAVVHAATAASAVAGLVEIEMTDTAGGAVIDAAL